MNIILARTSREIFIAAPAITDDLSMPDSCMYGQAGEQAKLLQAPTSWAYPAILTLYAGMGVNATFSGSEPLPP